MRWLLFFLPVFLCGLEWQQESEIASSKAPAAKPEAPLPTPNPPPVPDEKQGDLGAFLFHADFLYWQADEGELGAGLGLQQVSNNEFAVSPLHFEFNWNPGFRIGFGGQFHKHDDWSIKASWTHLISTANSHEAVKLSSLSPHILVPTVFDFPALTTFDYRFDWKSRYDVIDLMLQEMFYCTKFLSVEPGFGVCTAWIHQKVRSGKTAVIDTSGNTISVIGQQSMKAHSNFWGIGIRTGVDVRWYILKHFNLINKLSASFLRGKFHMEELGIIPFQNQQGQLGTPTGITVSDRVWHNQLNFEGALGLEWTQTFSEEKHYLSLAALYEMSYWADMNRFRGLQTFGSGNGPPSFITFLNGGLSFQGLTFNFSFGY